MFSKNTGLSTRKMNLNIFQQRRLDKVEEYTTSTTVLSTLRLDEPLGEGGVWILYHLLWQRFFLFLILGEVDSLAPLSASALREHAVKLRKKSNVCSPG